MAGATLGVSNNTLGAYERGEVLPDVDFLAKFAAVTGADFNELLRLRLACGKTEEARRLAESKVDTTAIDAQLDRIEKRLDEVLPGVGEVPLRAEEVEANQQLREIQQAVKDIAASDQATEHQKARADKIAQLVFGGREATARDAARFDNVLERLRAATQAIVQAVEEVGYDPGALWTSTLQELIFVHNLTPAGARRIIETLARERGQKR